MSSRLGVAIRGGNGIGASCCKVMARQGWRGAVVDLNKEAAQRVAEEVSGSAYELDIGSLAAVEQLADRLEEEHGRVSGLVVAVVAHYGGVPGPAEPWQARCNRQPL